ncbi:unnamed protein product, partial [Ectocarpus sp. 13 AM-2016]
LVASTLALRDEFLVPPLLPHLQAAVSCLLDWTRP